MPRTSKTDASAQAKDPSPQPEAQTQLPLDDIAQTIAQRYYVDNKLTQGLCKK